MFTTDVLDPVLRYCTTHCWDTVVGPHGLWLASISLNRSGVVSEASFGGGVALLLASAAPFFKVDWALSQSRIGQGVPVVIAGAPHLREPAPPIPMTPARPN